MTISIDFGSENRPRIQQDIVAVEGSTVLDVLRIAVAIVTSRKFGMDDFVEEIAGVKNEFATDCGWQFEVNGYRSNVPAERYLTGTVPSVLGIAFNPANGLSFIADLGNSSVFK